MDRLKCLLREVGSLECYLVLSGEGCTVYEQLLHSMELTWRFFQRLFYFLMVFSS